MPQNNSVSSLDGLLKETYEDYMYPAPCFRFKIHSRSNRYCWVFYVDSKMFYSDNPWGNKMIPITKKHLGVIGREQYNGGPVLYLDNKEFWIKVKQEKEFSNKFKDILSG